MEKLIEKDKKKDKKKDKGNHNNHLDNDANVAKLRRRSTATSTHQNIVDESIKEIQCYKINKNKRTLYMIFSVLSLGILNIVSNYLPKLYLSLVCNPSDVQEAKYFLITDKDKNLEIVDSKLESFYSRNYLLSKNIRGQKMNYKKELSESIYKGQDYFSLNEETIVFTYKMNKYIYIETDNVFESIKFDISGMKNKEIIATYSSGITSILDYNYLLNKFEKNSIEMEIKGFLAFLLQVFFNPIFLFQIYTLIVWIIDDYYLFAIIVIIVAIAVVITNTYQNFTNLQRIFNFYEFSSLNSKRSFEVEYYDKDKKKTYNLNKDSRFLVPGDVIQIEKSDKFMCDALLLEGYCSVSESDISGESTILMKSQIPKNNLQFSYTTNHNSIIYAGSVIEKCNSNNESGIVYGLVLNTGINTVRGNSIQNILFPKPTNFSLKKESIIIFLIIVVLFGLNIYTLTNYYWKNLVASTSPEETLEIKSDFKSKLMSLITILIPPSLPICFTFIVFYFQYKLGNKNIKCLSDLRLYAAGRVNVLILDKTGTITEDDLELDGFQTTCINELDSNPKKVTDFDKIQPDAKLYNKVYTEFWKKFANDPNNSIFDNYKENYNFNMIFFLECLATCHSVDKMNDESLGNTIDLNLLNSVKWVQEKSSFIDNENDILKYDMYPKNSSRITEDSVFKKSKIKKKCNPFKHTIIKRFEFESKYQSMSVIVKNNFDETYRYFIKGAPERICHICDKNSIPVEFNDVLEEHTRMGYRVLACATKVIPEKHDYDIEVDRKKFETKLQFLGFILFKNRLKVDSKNVISKINKSNIKLVMATGDNPFTSISVARESDLISNEINNIYLCELEKGIYDDQARLKCFAVNKDKQQKDEEIKDLYASEDYNKSNRNSEGIFHKKKDIFEQRRTKALTLGNIQKLDHQKQLDKQNTGELMAPPLMKTQSHEIVNETPEKNVLDIVEKLTRVMEKNPNNLICISGKAFNYLLENFIQEQELNKELNIKGISDSKLYQKSFDSLLVIIEKHCKIFYRMQPNDKVNLVNFYKSNPNNITAMCGDGSNDCGALFCADVGISIKKKEGSNISSHFFSEEQSIGCIDVILKNGRACLENSLVVLKFNFVYAFNQTVVATFLYTFNEDMTNSQYFSLDCFTSFLFCLIACKLSVNYSLESKYAVRPLIGLEFIVSVIIQLCISNLLLFGFIYGTLLNTVDPKSDFAYDKLGSDMTIINCFCYLINAFQNITAMFVFNAYSKQRKAYYLNKPYLLYFGIMIFYVTVFLTLPAANLSNLMFGLRVCEVDYAGYNDQNYPPYNDGLRITTIFIFLVYFIVSHVMESIITKVFGYNDEGTTDDKVKDKVLKNDTDKELEKEKDTVIPLLLRPSIAMTSKMRSHDENEHDGE